MAHGKASWCHKRESNRSCSALLMPPDIDFSLRKNIHFAGHDSRILGRIGREAVSHFTLIDVAGSCCRCCCSCCCCGTKHKCHKWKSHHYCNATAAKHTCCSQFTIQQVAWGTWGSTLDHGGIACAICLGRVAILSPYHRVSVTGRLSSVLWAPSQLARSIRFTVSCGSLVISATLADCCAETSPNEPQGPY